MAKSTWSNTLECSKRARINKIGPDELLARRQAMSRTLIDRLGEVIEGLREKAVPKSPMGKAFTYAINRWSTLTVFLTDGRIPIDNLHVERRHRVVALGGRNCLFCGSDEGARRHAIISAVLLASANSFAYLHDVITKLTGDWPSARIAKLMPVAWAAAQQRAGTRRLSKPLSAEASLGIFLAPSIVFPQYCPLRCPSARWPGPDA
jgi:hypothetical protein